MLEIGTASGFLCFEIERRGAEVVALDLDASLPVDMVPFAGDDQREARAGMARLVGRQNRAWWLGHHAFGSRARLVHARGDAVPAAIGPVDAATFGCVLLHVRDPFAVLASALRLTRHTAIAPSSWGRACSPPRGPSASATRSRWRRCWPGWAWRRRCSCPITAPSRPGPGGG